jgi:hypothetical protein
MKPEPTFTIDEIEGLLAQLPSRDPKLEGFTSTELRNAIEQDTGQRHSQKWIMTHYVRPLVRGGIVKPKMIARIPECGLAWTHILGYVFRQQEGEA